MSLKISKRRPKLAIAVLAAEFSKLPHSGCNEVTRTHAIQDAASGAACLRRLTWRAPLGARPELGRGDQVGIQHDPNLAAQEIKQDRDPLALRHALE